MDLFNQETNEKLGKAIDFRNNLLGNYQNKPKRKILGFLNPFEMNDFIPANPNSEEVKKVNHLFAQSIKFAGIYFFYLLFGLGYCIKRSYKFYKSRIFTKSLYAWGGFFAPLIIFPKMIEVKFQKNLNVEIEKIYLSLLFRNEYNKFRSVEEKEGFTKLLLSQLELYKNSI